MRFLWALRLWPTWVGKVAFERPDGTDYRFTPLHAWHMAWGGAWFKVNRGTP